VMPARLGARLEVSFAPKGEKKGFQGNLNRELHNVHLRPAIIAAAGTGEKRENRIRKKQRRREVVGKHILAVQQRKRSWRWKNRSAKGRSGVSHKSRLKGKKETDATARLTSDNQIKSTKGSKSPEGAGG